MVEERRTPPFKPGDVTSGKIKLDMSEFHDLMHWPGTRYCRSMPGGTRNHLKMGWENKWREDLQRPFRKIMCKLGRHYRSSIFYWNKEADDWDEVIMCYWCGKRYDQEG